jgi:glutamine amidotransferase
MRVSLFDFGVGNLHSLGKALSRCGANVTVVHGADGIVEADAIVLPGVGAFGAAASALAMHRERVAEALRDGTPCLGICLGMQLFFETSEESAGDGIGFVPGEVRLLDARIVPQMGWNDVETGPDPVFEGLEPLVAYYANSYVCVPEVEDDAIAWSEYDGRRFAAGVRRGNTWGFQFHPEKSSGPGRRIIANFVALARGDS